ncbi:MAG: transposase [Clostridia bacterium]|nr:transposase [Clostridia bacterium]
MELLPKRKATRLKNYDYSAHGAYFITICVKDKKCILGKIVGDGDFDVPQMILSEYGVILDKYIHLMNDKYSHIKTDKYVIMPNHIHLILSVTAYKNGASETAAPYNNEISKFISLLKRYCNREYSKNIFQRSFNDHIIRGEKDYAKISEYIDTNIIRWQKDCFYYEEGQ